MLDTDADLETKWPLITSGRPDFLKVYLVLSEDEDPTGKSGHSPQRSGLHPRLVAQIVAKAHAAGLSTRPSNVRGYQLRHLSKIFKDYFFVGAFLAGALAAGLSESDAAALACAVFTEAAFAGGTAALALLSAVGAAVFAFASAVGAMLSVLAAGASGLLLSTETLPVRAGIARSRADNINVDAAVIVTLDNTVAVPRGANAELDTLLVNKAPASVLPGCSKTAAIKTRHERKKIPYKI